MDFQALHLHAIGKGEFETLYDKIRVLGKGAYGVAWLVRRKGHRTKYVAKEIPYFPEDTGSGKLKGIKRSLVDLANNEVSVLSRLSHPNVVRYIDEIQEKDRIFIVMEYANGGDLGKLIRRRSERKEGPVEEKDILWLFMQLLLGLRYVHGCKLVHRDIKAANVLLTREGVVKIGDFGLTKVLSSQHQQASSVCGTPNYYAPELCSNEPYSSKADIWAAGVILYQLMTLKHPFEGEDRAQVFRRISRGDYDTPDPTNTLFSADLKRMLRSIFSLEPSQRPTAEALLGLPIMVPQLERLSRVEAATSGSPQASPKHTLALMSPSSSSPTSGKPHHRSSAKHHHKHHGHNGGGGGGGVCNHKCEDEKVAAHYQHNQQQQQQPLPQTKESNSGRSEDNAELLMTINEAQDRERIQELLRRLPTTPPTHTAGIGGVISNISFSPQPKAAYSPKGNLRAKTGGGGGLYSSPVGAHQVQLPALNGSPSNRNSNDRGGCPTTTAAGPKNGEYNTTKREHLLATPIQQRTTTAKMPSQQQQQQQQPSLQTGATSSSPPPPLMPGAGTGTGTGGTNTRPRPEPLVSTAASPSSSPQRINNNGNQDPTLYPNSTQLNQDPNGILTSPVLASTPLLSDEDFDGQRDDGCASPQPKSKITQREAARDALNNTSEAIMDRPQFDAWLTRTIDDNAKRRRIRQLISKVTICEEGETVPLGDQCAAFDEIMTELGPHYSQLIHMTLMSVIFSS